MGNPSKRQKLSDDSPDMGRWQRRDLVQLDRRQRIVDVTLQVSATLVVSVDVDADGVPTATTTLTPTDAEVPTPPTTSSSSSSSSALTPQPAIFTTRSSSQAAPASGISPTASRTGANPTVTSFSPPSSGGNSTSISNSISATLPAIISGNSTLASASSRSSSLRSYSSSSLESLTSSSSDLSLSSSSVTASSSTGFIAPTLAGLGGVPGGAAGSATTGVSNGPIRNGTAKGPSDNGTSPPVVAGAVVGSVGGVAVLLLVLVLVARWWKHHTRLSRLEEGNESSLNLHNGPPGQPPTSRRSFLAAAGWLNRLSGAHQNRSSSPTLPPVAEQERGFQKISGRKLPSQFPTGMEEGPVARDFEPHQPSTRAAHLSDTSSYYRDSRDTTHFFGPAPAVQPLFAGATSESPSPPHGHEHEHEHGRGGQSHLAPTSSPFDDSQQETLMPSPARTPQIYSHTDGQYFQSPPTSPWPGPYLNHDDDIRPAPRR